MNSSRPQGGWAESHTNLWKSGTWGAVPICTVEFRRNSYGCTDRYSPRPPALYGCVHATRCGQIRSVQIRTAPQVPRISYKPMEIGPRGR